MLGFQHRHEAERFQNDLQDRVKKFGWELYPDKTQLLEFERFAATNRQPRGDGKPETFDFLGFTHICGVRRQARTFLLKRKTTMKRMRTRLQVLRDVLYRGRHRPFHRQAEWLSRVVLGYFRYFAIPGNIAALESFRTQVLRDGLMALRRRGQKHRRNWEGFGPRVARLIPHPRILHPYPEVRFRVKHPKQEPCAVMPHARICPGGGSQELSLPGPFIMITHKKRTMSCADVLFGITMQESGISKQVAVRLDDYPEEEKQKSKRRKNVLASQC